MCRLVSVRPGRLGSSSLSAIKCFSALNPILLKFLADFSNSLHVLNLRLLLKFCLFGEMSHCMRKPTKNLGRNKGADQLCSNCTADKHLVLAIQIVQYPFYFNPKFQASVTVQAGLCRTWLETQTVAFLMRRLINVKVNSFSVVYGLNHLLFCT